jgi:glycosyltransferase involved in cell wall biosynthesis
MDLHMKKVLHLMAAGGTGGIETLAREYSSMSELENHYLFLYKGGEIADDIAKNNENVRILGKKSYQIICTYYEIEKYVIENDISIVISHHGVDFLWLYLYLLKVRHPERKTVIYAHSYYADELVKKGIRKRIDKIIFYKAYSRADGLIAISEAVKKGLVSLSIEKTEKIHVIYNGVDVGRFCPINRNFNEPPTIIYVGRLEYVKGVHKLLRALSLVNEPFKCLIVGEGSQKESLADLIKELKLGDRVTMTGRRSDVDHILQSADIFVHPAIWNEGFGISLVEAMASGLLCIAYNRGAMTEIIDDKINGFIVEPDTIEALAEQLSIILEKPELERYRDMREKASVKAKTFSIEKYVSCMDQYCKSV